MLDGRMYLTQELRRRHLPEGAQTKRRTCQKAHKPDGAHAKGRDGRGAQLPKHGTD